jgi:hypothetical protein
MTAETRPSIPTPRIAGRRPASVAGTSAFREADRDFFFGRNAEADELTERVERNRLTVPLASQVSASPLMRAGLFRPAGGTTFRSISASRSITAH